MCAYQEENFAYVLNGPSLKLHFGFVKKTNLTLYYHLKTKRSFKRTNAAKFGRVKVNAFLLLNW